MRKKGVCRFWWETGMCKKGVDCQYDHAEGEIKKIWARKRLRGTILRTMKIIQEEWRKDERRLRETKWGWTNWEMRGWLECRRYEGIRVEEAELEGRVVVTFRSGEERMIDIIKERWEKEIDGERGGKWRGRGRASEEEEGKRIRERIEEELRRMGMDGIIKVGEEKVRWRDGRRKVTRGRVNINAYYRYWVQERREIKKERWRRGGRNRLEINTWSKDPEIGEVIRIEGRKENLDRQGG